MIKAINFTLLAGLVLGFLWVVPASGEGWQSYVLPFLSGFILMAITLALLRRRRPYNVAVLGVIIIFWFAYFIRFFFILANPSLVWFLVPAYAWPSFDDPGIRQTSFIYLCAAFCTFCISVIFFRLASEGRVKRCCVAGTAPTTRMGIDAGAPSLWFVVYAVLALVLLNIIFLSYGIGVLGTFVENPLPFKLTGAVVYAKSVVVPCWLVLHIYWAQKGGWLVPARLGVLVLLLSGVFDMFIFHSRGALLAPLILVGLVWLLAGFRLYKFDKFVLLAFLGGCLLAIPVISAIRIYGSPLETFSMNQVWDGIIFVFFRITGIDQFMVILNLGQPISFDNIGSVLSSPRGIAGYYTTALLQYGEDIPQTFAPSMLGWLYLVGGLPGIIGGSVLLGFLVTYGWNFLGRIYSQCAPVIKSYFLMFLLFTVTEGIAKSAIIGFLIVAALLWFMEKHSNVGKKMRLAPPIVNVSLEQA